MTIRVALRLGALLTTASLLSGLLGSCASSTAQRSTDGNEGIVGFKWRIVKVQHDGSTIAIPAEFGGYISFTPGQTLLAHDGVNGYFGHFVINGDGYHVSTMAVSLAGSSGTAPPAQVALVGAVRAATEQAKDVRVKVHGDQSYLSRTGYKITCIRAGAARDPSTPESPTTSRSTS